MFTLAHLSDPHLSPLPRPRLGELVGKRVTGFLSWSLRRKAIHGGPVLERLTADLRETAPDHIVVTGDIINISLPGEYTQAEAWLRRLGPPERVTIIPGNHDAYVVTKWPESIGLWAAYMAGSAPGRSDGETAVCSNEDFPFLRIRGPLAIVGVSTACPMPPLSAAGRIGEQQLDKLKQQLEQLGREGLFRVVLIHHPPFDSRDQRRKGLLDSGAFRAVVAEVGAELILHGHTHRSGLAKLPTPDGFAPVIGVPSASAKYGHDGRGHSQYHLYRVQQDGNGWRIDVEVRGVVPTLDRFERESRFSLAIPH
ncbi:MAG: metallophosphoesterase family protein [Dongiaceae bacterium]